MRRPKRLPRGIFVRTDRGTDWYWIRYFDQRGRKHREKASPPLERAKAALEKRRTEVREGKVVCAALPLIPASCLTR